MTLHLGDQSQLSRLVIGTRDNSSNRLDDPPVGVAIIAFMSGNRHLHGDEESFVRQREQGSMEDLMSAVGFVTTQRETSSKTNQSEFANVYTVPKGAEVIILGVSERRGW